MTKVKIWIACCTLCLSSWLMNSCQKGVQNNPGNGTDTTGNNNTVDPVVDTALAYTNDVYLWYNQIPATFKGNGIKSPDSLMIAIRQYSHEAGYSSPVDRFSFAEKKVAFDDVSSGVAQDFGLYARFLAGTNQLYVLFVEKDGPAGKAGIQRGWQFVQVNGSTNIDTTSSSINFLNTAIFNSTSSSFVFKTPDGRTVSTSLTVGTYQSHSVLADTVLSTSSGNVGYMAFNSFLGDSLDIDTNLKRVFQKFEQNSISDVVIDLRYNGGGYVYNSEKLANYLAPSAANGQTMFTEQFNDKHTSWNETFKFNKTNSLNLKRIFFIVSDETASASELLINNLKPFMDVKLVGPAYHTYGKPVGFFNIPVGDWYIFPVSFRSINNAGTSNYFNGFTIDKPVNDGVNRNWGDPSEYCLAAVLKYITTGSFSRIDGTERKFQEISQQVKRINKYNFNGTLDSRRLRK